MIMDVGTKFNSLNFTSRLASVQYMDKYLVINTIKNITKVNKQVNGSKIDIF